MQDDEKPAPEKRAPLYIKKTSVDNEPLPPRGGRTMIWDTQIKGFGVRIAASGTKTYILRYRMGGRSTPIRTVVIGRHGSPYTPEQARTRAAELLLQVRNGIDPVAQKQAQKEMDEADAVSRENRLFATMAESWFKKHVEREGLRSAKDIRGVLDRDLKPAFEGKTVDEIKKKDVTAALDGIGERSGSAANKTHKWGRQLFNWLIDQGEIEHSPMAKVKKPFPETERTRVLSLAEVVVVWMALDSVDEPFRSFYRLAILLGQRLRENSNVPWSEFDFEAEEWLLPEERTKAKRDHLVPLSQQAIDILHSIKPDPATRVGIVFTTNGLVGISGFSKMKEALDEAIDELIKSDSRAKALVGDALTPWVVHDLRRTIATTGQAMGFQLEHTEAVLNHAIGKRGSGTAKVYHLYDFYDEKAEVIERWGELVEKAVALFKAGDVEGVRELDPARRARRSRKTPRSNGEI